MQPSGDQPFPFGPSHTGLWGFSAGPRLGWAVAGPEGSWPLGRRSTPLALLAACSPPSLLVLVSGSGFVSSSMRPVGAGAGALDAALVCSAALSQGSVSPSTMIKLLTHGDMPAVAHHTRSTICW